MKVGYVYEQGVDVEIFERQETQYCIVPRMADTICPVPVPPVPAKAVRQNEGVSARKAAACLLYAFILADCFSRVQEPDQA